MTDEIGRHNQQCWENLARQSVRYSRPMLDLTPETARELVDPEGMMGTCRGKDVLCLAGGGGQQSAAYALLGANVTVVDLSETQLQRDRETAQHYGVDVKAIHSDMRDLSVLKTRSFDLVNQAHSINFVPDPDAVFHEVTRVIRPGGLYRLTFTNPFTHGLSEEDWDGNGYPLSLEYADGEILAEDHLWYFEDEEGNEVAVEGPVEFRHTLSTVINELTSRGFVILGLWEDVQGDPDAEPGTWDHYKRIAAPWLTVWSRFNPRAFLKTGLPA